MEPYGLGLEQKIMPQYFKESGYRTHLIGKWHQGFFQRQYTPTFRGYDSFIGFYGGFVGYYNYQFETADHFNASGFDLRKNLTVFHDFPKGTYATDLFTAESVRTIEDHNFEIPLYLQLNHLAPHSGNDINPLEAPESEIQKFMSIKDPRRRVLAGKCERISFFSLNLHSFISIGNYAIER